MHDIAREERVTAAYLYTLLRLPWLAPDITTAIVNGRQPPQLNAKKLMRLKHSYRPTGPSSEHCSAFAEHIVGFSEMHRAINFVLEPGLGRSTRKSQRRNGPREILAPTVGEILVKPSQASI